MASQKFWQLVLKHHRMVLVIMALLLVAAYWHLSAFRLDASADSLVLENDDDLRYYRQTSERYGGESFLVLTFTPDQALFSAPVLDQFAELESSLTSIPGVGGVVSLLDMPLLMSPPLAFNDLSGEIHTLRSPNVDLALAREEFTHSPFYQDLIVSSDASTTALMITFIQDEPLQRLFAERQQLRQKKWQGVLTQSDEKRLAVVEQEYQQRFVLRSQLQKRVIDDVRELMVTYSDDAVLHLGGVPMITADMISFIKSDISVFGIIVLLFLLATLAVIFRQWVWVVMPLLICASTVLLMLGYLGRVEWPVTVISSNFIALLLVITMSMTIHLIVRFREIQLNQPDWPKTQWILETLKQMVKPCVYTALTTIVAFLSLVASGIRPVIDFGWMMGIGITVALMTVFLLFPSLLMVFNPAPASNGDDLSRRFTLGLSKMTQHLAIPLLLMALGVAVLSGWGISKLSVDNRFVDYFDEETEIYQGMVYIDRYLGGTIPLDIILDAPGEAVIEEVVIEGEDSVALISEPSAVEQTIVQSPTQVADEWAESDGIDDEWGDESWGEDSWGDDSEQNPLADSYWFNPAKLAELEAIHQYLESLPETGKVLSLATTVSVASQLNGNEPLGYFQLLLLSSFIPDDLKSTLINPYIAEDGSQLRISTRLYETEAPGGRDALLKKINTDLQQQFNLQPEQIHLTGMAVLYNNMLQSLYQSQILTLGAVFLGIMIMFVVLFRSIKLAVIGIAPNLFSAAVVLGLMGWLAIPLDFMTITIAAIVIGIAVDNTIHYVVRFKRERAVGASWTEAIDKCHGSIGRAIYYTSMTIVVGFSILALSNFKPTIYFGLLTALAMAIALLANLTLLPALLLTFKPKVKWQKG